METVVFGKEYSLYHVAGCDMTALDKLPQPCGANGSDSL